MEVKQLTLENINTVIDLYIRAFNQAPWFDQWTAKTVTNRLRMMLNCEGSYGLIGYQNNQPVGIILGVEEQNYDGKIFQIKELCIDPTCVSKGLGSELLKNLELVLNEKGIKRIYLYTLRTNATIQFYEKNHYTINDAIIMMQKNKDCDIIEAA